MHTPLSATAARDRRIARMLQQALLLTPPPNRFPNLSVEVAYASGLDEAVIGGDFFDAFALPAGAVALLVGDVAGKGLSAALRTAAVKFALRAFLREMSHPEPGTALGRLNRFVCDAQSLDGWDEGVVVCAALVVLYPATGEACVSLAGAEAPLLVSGADGDASATPASADYGLPLGVLSDSQYAGTLFRVPSGATLLLATDGITEARREFGDKTLLGYDGMIRLATPGVAASVVLEGARAFAGGRLQDDACVLLARRLAV